MDNLQAEIDSSNISEKDLEEIGWERVCGNLPRHIAEQMIAVNPSQVIVQDELNDFMWVVMMKISNIQIAGEVIKDEVRSNENP